VDYYILALQKGKETEIVYEWGKGKTRKKVYNFNFDGIKEIILDT